MARKPVQINRDIAETKDSYTHKIVKGASVIFIMGLLASFFGYLLRFVLARELTTAEFGLVYSILSLFGLIGVFKDLGLNVSLAKYIPAFLVHKDYGKIKSSIVLVLAIQIAISIITGSVIILLSKWLAENYFHSPLAYPMLLVYSFAFMITPLHTVFKPIFQGFQYMNFYSLIDFLKAFFLLALSFAFLVMGYGAVSVMASHLVVFLAMPFLVYLPMFLRKALKIPEFAGAKIRIKLGLCRKLVKFGLPMTIGEVAGLIQGYSDTLILTYFSLTQVGFYNVAYPISKLLWRFSNTLAIVFFPMSAELWEKNDIERIHKGINALHKYLIVFIIPLSILVFVFAEVIITIFFGEKYISASNALRILVLGTVFYAVSQVNTSALLGMGKPMLVTKLTIIISVFNLVTNLIFIPFFGVVGASSTTAASFFILMILSTIKLKQMINFKLSFGVLSKVVFANILFGAGLFGLGKLLTLLGFNFWLVAAAAVVVSSVLYVLFLFLLKVITVQEIKKILNILFRRNSK